MRPDATAALAATLALIEQARRSGVDVGMVRTTATRPPFLDKVAKPQPPALWIVADIAEGDKSTGLDGFDAISLIALRERVDAVVVNEADACASNYGAALARALLHREIVAVVETTQRHCADWTTFFTAKSDGPPTMLTMIVPPDGYA
jgi:hypothetical protein